MEIKKNRNPQKKDPSKSFVAEPYTFDSNRNSEELFQKHITELYKEIGYLKRYPISWCRRPGSNRYGIATTGF